MTKRELLEALAPFSDDVDIGLSLRHGSDEVSEIEALLYHPMTYNRPAMLSLSRGGVKYDPPQRPVVAYVGGHYATR